MDYHSVSAWRSRKLLLNKFALHLKDLWNKVAEIEECYGGMVVEQT